MLKVEGLCKDYPAFSLVDVGFEVPKGFISGFIGLNGAGKTTTFKSILNHVFIKSGKIEIFGLDHKAHEQAIKQRIGYMPGAFDYYSRLPLKKIVNVYKMFFDRWDNELFLSYTERFKLDLKKKVTELSTGMKVKFGLALALSHKAELFIFDEPTSGLDPIARDEILDIFRTIVSDGEHSILFSTHITSDLDKCADFIIYIKDGRVILSAAKDDLVNGHLMISGKCADLTDDILRAAVSIKTNAYGFSALIKDDGADLSRFAVSRPTIEDIMIYYDKAAGAVGGAEDGGNAPGGTAAVR